MQTIITRLFLTVFLTGLATSENVPAPVIESVPEEPANLRVSYKGTRIISICDNESDKFKELTQKLLEESALGPWGQTTECTQFYVVNDKVKYATDEFKKHGILFDILTEDLQRAIDSENIVEDEEVVLTGKKGHRLKWTSYCRTEEHYSFLDYCAQTYNSVSVGILGYSVEGRPIKYIKISSGSPDAKAIWIDGGIHAREWISPAAVSYIINELVENPEKYSEYTKGIDFYFAPILNPDGYEYTHTRDRLWRKNRSKGGFYCQGTDLNRNWGYMWGGKGSSNKPCQEIYAGRGPFSEPETLAASTFIRKIKNLQGFLTFHAYGQYILYPYGYDKDKLTDDYEDLDRVAREMAEAMKKVNGSTYTVGNSANLLYAAAGGSDDWARGVCGVKYTYTIELRDEGRYGFILPNSLITVTAIEALASVLKLAEAVRDYDQE